MTQLRVVVVASDDDFAADMVVRHLRRTTFVRLDPGKPRVGHPVRARVGPSGDSWTVGLPIGPETAVYWRKPTLATDLQGDAAWAADETTTAVLGTLRAGGVARWMNDPDTVTKARPKLPQLTLARAVGMAVPDTLITTDAADAAAFIADGPTIVKALTQRHVEFAPAWQITEADSLEGIEPVPHAFQRLVDKAADLRVTIVGGDIFACRITSPDVDWRTDHSACKYEAVTLDDTTAGQLRQYMQAASLAFGAFDLAVTADGVPWFLECNANGEFGFQEALTGAPITQAMAAWLLRKE